MTRVIDRLGHALHFGTSQSGYGAERRNAMTRPQEGAIRSCPSCRGVLLFRESYRILRTDRGAMEPAWICHTRPCGYREFVRR